MRSYRKRSAITLLEIMIVILLIGLIGGVLSYNLKGTMDRGKKFRTEEGMRRLKDILNLAVEENPDLIKQLKDAKDASIVEQCVTNSGFVQKDKVKDFLLDGWSMPYTVTVEQPQDQPAEIKVESPGLKQYNSRK